MHVIPAGVSISICLSMPGAIGKSRADIVSHRNVPTLESDLVVAADGQSAELGNVAESSDRVGNERCAIYVGSAESREIIAIFWLPPR
jgi:hypothetical protein